MPFSVRCYIFGLVVVAVSAVATLPLSKTDPRLLLALCALVVAAERLSRVSMGVSGWTMSVSLVVTLITVMVLAPPAAALVGLVTSLTLPRRPNWTWTKQIVNSSMMTLVPAAGAGVCHLAGGHAPGAFLNFPEFLWPVAAAVTTCLVANALVITGYTGLATHTRFVDALRGDIRRATMPYYSSAVLALIFLSLWKDIGWYTAPLVVVPMYIAHWSLSQYAMEGAAHEGTIAALVQAVEIKDSYTRGHSERVARGAEMLAAQLKMPQDRLAMLRFAGLLHDIGKLGVPTRLLTSTGGLTEEEFKLLCMHPNHGVAVLRDIRFLTEVYEGVLYHHERLDGRGYPTGKSGDDIPEFARIIGVADAFDAMTSTRSYRAARSVEEAVAELRRGAGTQFDPDLVRAFEAALELAERSGTPWVPTELVPAAPQPDDDEAAAAATGPWPLPKRVPGFSFADHDDPFVPVEWFSDWYPSWLAPGGIPGQRAGEAEAEAAVVAGAGPRPPASDEAAEADFDDGWSERMYSAVVREAGPEPDEGPGDEGGAGAAAEAAADTEGESGDSAEAAIEPEPAADASSRWPVDPGLDGLPRGSMRVRGATRAADPDPRGPAAGLAPDSDPDPAAVADSGADSDGAEPTSGADADSVPAADLILAAALAADMTPAPAAPAAKSVSADASAADLAAASGADSISTAASVADPAVASVGDSVSAADLAAAAAGADSVSAADMTPAPVASVVDPTPAADFDLRKPVVTPCRDSGSAAPAAELLDDGDDNDDTIPIPRPKPGDPEAWTPSPEPWSAPTPPAEAAKAAAEPEPADADSGRGPAAPSGPSWFSRGAGGSSPMLHFFGPGGTGPWPPRDPDAKDSEGSPA